MFEIKRISLNHGAQYKDQTRNIRIAWQEAESTAKKMLQHRHKAISRTKPSAISITQIGGAHLRIAG